MLAGLGGNCSQHLLKGISGGAVRASFLVAALPRVTPTAHLPSTD